MEFVETKRGEQDMIIETERLILRPFTEDDSEDVYEYLKELAVNCFAFAKMGD